MGKPHPYFSPDRDWFIPWKQLGCQDYLQNSHMKVFKIPGLLQLFESYSQHILATPSCKTVESLKSNSNELPNQYMQSLGVE